MQLRFPVSKGWVVLFFHKERPGDEGRWGPQLGSHADTSQSRPAWGATNYKGYWMEMGPRAAAQWHNHKVGEELVITPCPC